MSGQFIPASPFAPGELFPARDELADVTPEFAGTSISDMLNLMETAEFLDEWPEPEQLADALPAVAEFELDLLPKSLRPLVEDVAERMQVPLDFPAIAAVATLAGVTNRRAVIQPKRNDTTWTVVPNLWGGIVAAPGMLKSPVIACVTQPAREIESGWRDAYQIEELQFQRESEKQELLLSAWKEQFKAAAKVRARVRNCLKGPNLQSKNPHSSVL